MLKKILKVIDIILKPFHYIGNYAISEKIVLFVNRHKWILYILATLLTALYIVIKVTKK